MQPWHSYPGQDLTLPLLLLNIIVQPLSRVQSLSHVQLFATPWQHARLPCSSLSPRVCWNSCPLSWWCHPTILSSVSPFSSCPQSFPASESFPVTLSLFLMRWRKYWSFSFSISPSNNEYSGLISFRIDWFDPCSPGKSQESSPAVSYFIPYS